MAAKNMLKINQFKLILQSTAYQFALLLLSQIDFITIIVEIIVKNYQYSLKSSSEEDSQWQIWLRNNIDTLDNINNWVSFIISLIFVIESLFNIFIYQKEYFKSIYNVTFGTLTIVSFIFDLINILEYNIISNQTIWWSIIVRMWIVLRIISSITDLIIRTWIDPVEERYRRQVDIVVDLTERLEMANIELRRLNELLIIFVNQTSTNNNNNNYIYTICGTKL
ncbi:hypothetical protein BLOT_010520 [Blomia tropicalis]|nr:hypothetical protein BLOT_010520 [Blomia tropicalis]